MSGVNALVNLLVVGLKTSTKVAGPATKTRPSGSGAARVLSTGLALIDLVGENELVAGSKISALCREMTGPPSLVKPPATSTRPSGSGAPAWHTRSTVIEPVGEKEPVAGSKISALRSSDGSLPPA